MALKGKLICLTGFNSTESSSLEKIIESLEGIFSVPLTRQVYCLVSNKYGTDKHTVATQQNIPVVTINWIRKCYESKTLVPTNDYAFKLFTGLILTVSGIYGSARIALVDAVNSYGGVCTSGLIDETTHLICLEAVGEKYDVAKTLSTIKIVKPEWLYDSIKANR